MQLRKLLLFILAPLSLLLIPLLAMQFTAEVNWTLFDFLVAGVLLSTSGLLFAFLIRFSKNTTTRVILGAAILIVLILLWAELAVGIFGSVIAGQ